MTLVNEIRRTVIDTTPVYAAVGVTDLAVELVRDARVRAAAARADFDVSALQDQAVKRAEKVAEQAQLMPAHALSQTLEAAGKAATTYAELAVRGEKLVKRLRDQKATKDLLIQAESTLSLGKGAVTTVRKAAVDTQRAALATLATGRQEAEDAFETVVASVQHEAKAATGTVRNAATRTVRKSTPATRIPAKSTPATRIPAKRTATAAKRTATTAKKSTASARLATKAAANSAAKTATAAAEATKTATPKVGD